MICNYCKDCPYFKIIGKVQHCSQPYLKCMCNHPKAGSALLLNKSEINSFKRPFCPLKS